MKAAYDDLAAEAEQADDPDPFEAALAELRDGRPDAAEALFRKIVEERRALAQGMRMQSQGNNANKAENIMDVTPEEVVRVMEEASVKHLIHGHTHRPNIHDVALADGQGKRWVLGDWGKLGWQIVADSEKGLRLESFEIN